MIGSKRGYLLCYIYQNSVSWIYLIWFPFGIFSDELDSISLPAGKSKPKPQVGKGKVNKGKNKIPAAPYNLTEEHEEPIAVWLESKKLLYDMKDKQYKDKALRRQLLDKIWNGL